MNERGFARNTHQAESFLRKCPAVVSYQPLGMDYLQFEYTDTCDSPEDVWFDVTQAPDDDLIAYMNGVRQTGIDVLRSTILPESIGLGGYAESAAYKLANGDISINTRGLTDVVRTAISIVGDLDFDEV